MKIKLTNNRDQTRNETQWGENVTHGPTSGSGPLCADGWLHYYEGLGVAMLRNPADANFQEPHVWRVKPSGKIKRERLKSGAQTVTTLERLDVVPPTMEQRATCAIILALEVVDAARNATWVAWAENWLSGEDRTVKAVYAAANAANAAAYAAAYAARRLDVNGVAEAVFGY